MDATEVAIRTAEPGDASRLAELAGQLGYPVAVDELAERLPAVSGNPDAALLVAVDGADSPIGWIHIELKPSLLAPLAAQVMGLVVDSSVRSAGIGAELLERGEAWARERGCHQVLVGTRVTRERAHGFYRRQGYGLLKTSHFFVKELGDPSAVAGQSPPHGTRT